jgi:putative hydrolase of the HAD superfamily
MLQSSKNILIDADDTLWENSIYFERVISFVQRLLGPHGVHPEAFRARLERTQMEHIPVYGYGTVHFARSLVEAFEITCPQTIREQLTPLVEASALNILNHPLEIIEGVLETLEYLSPKYGLYLVTKGDMEEQERKVQSSKLREYFDHVEILSEKNADAYRQLISKHGWDAGQTWMVGNSLRSDINPAIEAGLGAVFIPHPHTWALEHDEPVNSPRVIRLTRFSDLKGYF